MNTMHHTLTEMVRNTGGNSGTFYVVFWFPHTHYQT